MVRILIADDHDVMRRGIRNLLEMNVGWEICAEAATGREALDLAQQTKPDIAVLDLTLPDIYGLDVARDLLHIHAQTQILIFTMHESEQLVREVLSSGARGYVLKSDAARHLILAIEALIDHKPYFSSTISETLMRAFLQTPLPASSAMKASSSVVTAEQLNAEADDYFPPLGTDEPLIQAELTAREQQVVILLGKGKSNKEVAAELFISVKTVETHRATIMRKLGINSVVELVHYAIRTKLIDP
ncbi:MAG TPA: response regulator transcription factor [Acidobacteriota bacterium]|nr:response regulator transcription factor [Acidobacteriota bacterium]HNG91669.1 response regulator transcription factor [Acidobacteriota bacterium]